MLIRAMTIEDIPKVAQIEAQCFSLPWSENNFADSLKRDDTIFLVCERTTNNPPLQMREALSGGFGGFLCQVGIEKPYLTSCEAACVHEEVAKADSECPLYQDSPKIHKKIMSEKVENSFYDKENVEKLQNESYVSDKKVIGYIGMYISFDEGEITNVAVISSARQKGVGNALITAIKEASRQQKVQRIVLEVRVSNQPAIALYEKNGFIFVGKRKNFYENPIEDANIMICDIV